jgi:DHA1 family multidrug resistance protein-like MFS transporter
LPFSLRISLRSLESWQRMLAILWLAQFSVALGFSFYYPFIPLFIQDLGIEDPGQAALWAGIAGGVAGFFMMLSGPFWGILGDRYGRKKNILRSAFGSALVLMATGLVTDVYQLVAFRMLLGTVAGTLPTVMALGASMAPRDKGPFVVGIIQSASFLGFTIGPVIGGQLADQVGYRPSFFITGSMAALCGLLVVFFVREEFQKPERQGRLGPHLFVENIRLMFQSRALASGLLIMLLAQLGPTIMMPALPVFIGELSSSGTAASNTGVAFSLMGMMAVVSSIVFGKLSQRTGTKPILIASFVFGSLLNLPLFFVHELAFVYVVIAFLGFFMGGVNTMTFAVVGAAASREQQGAAYGSAMSAGALAFGTGPLVGGVVAGTWGIREVFLVNSTVLVITALLAVRLLKGPAASTPESADATEQTEQGPAA